MLNPQIGVTVNRYISDAFFKPYTRSKAVGRPLVDVSRKCVDPYVLGNPAAYDACAIFIQREPHRSRLIPYSVLEPPSPITKVSLSQKTSPQCA